MQIIRFFPVNTIGNVMLVPLSASVAPYTYVNGLKFDALGRVVTKG